MTTQRSTPHYTPLRRDPTYEHKVGNGINWLFLLVLVIGAIFFLSRLGII